MYILTIFFYTIILNLVTYNFLEESFHPNYFINYSIIEAKPSLKRSMQDFYEILVGPVFIVVLGSPVSHPPTVIKYRQGTYSD